MDEEEQKEDGIKDIKEVFYDNLDNWPTETIKKNLFRLRPEEGAEVYLNLSEGYHDITNQGLEVEKKFRPKVTIRTQELKTELDRWKIGGGAFFRVVADSPNLNTAMKLCIQYFIVWTRQLFPFQFSFLSIPFFIATLFLSQFTLEYQPGSATLGTYLTFLITGLIFICLGLWTYIEGMYKRFIKGYKSWKTVPDSMIGFVIPGIFFWTTALEYAIYNLTSTTDIATLIPVSAWLSVLIGVIVLFIGTDAFLRGEKSYVEKFSHPMDYAPLMLYLYKNKAGNWDIEGTQFDYFHYKTSFVPKEKLSYKEDEDEKKEHPWFLIDRSWHAFREYIKPNIMIRLFANVVFNIIAWLIIVGVYVIFILEKFWLDIGTLEANFTHPVFFMLIYVLLPIMMVFMLWSISRTREYKLPIWEDLSEKDDDELTRNHHLSYDRLRILWNLRNREHTGEQRFTEIWSKSDWIEGDSSRLVARVKMQFPFDRYKDWHTLRDTQEELLSLIAVQTKEEELRKLHAEIAEVKRDLQKQMIEGIDSIEEELDEYFDDQKEEIEEEREELKEILGVIEDEVVEETTTEDIETEEIIEETEPEVIDTVDEIIEEIEEVTEEVSEPAAEDIFDETEIPDIPDVDEEKEETPIKKDIEDLGVPDLPPVEEDKKEPEEEEEFTIPDIPIDVEKEED